MSYLSPDLATLRRAERLAAARRHQLATSASGRHQRSQRCSAVPDGLFHRLRTALFPSVTPDHLGARP